MVRVFIVNFMFTFGNNLFCFYALLMRMCKIKYCFAAYSAILQLVICSISTNIVVFYKLRRNPFSSS